MKAYYFQPKDGRLAYGDGREIKQGITHTVTCEPKLCKQGLHASVQPFDALQYAQSGTLWLVELSGVIVKGRNKCVATERTYIKAVDLTEVLWKMSRMCALDVVHLWDAPDVVVQYLKAGDETLRAAARDAAWAAARDAAWAAARTAASAAARAAARAAAWAAARDAARDAAWAAAELKQRERFLKLVNKAFKEV